MIKSYKCKETEKISEKGIISKKFPPSIQPLALRKLAMLKVAANIYDLRNPPSNNFEALLGKRNGQYSIRINMKWRICFTWIDNNAYSVEIVDYH